MSVSVDIWLRGTDFATTASIEGVTLAASDWTDEDVRALLGKMLQAMYRAKEPAEENPEIALRGLSWIVNPYEEGGVVIALEITLGAAVSGPFDIDQSKLEAMITRVLMPTPPTTSSVH